MSVLEIINKQKSLIKSINSILLNHGVTTHINLSDITIADNTVTDLVKEHKVLSNAIVDSIWPSIGVSEVYHYTSKASAEAILNSEKFRLYNLLKRFDEGEIITFCQNHNLNGFLQKDANGVPKYKTLIMDNMFYASFTDCRLSPQQEQYFWKYFGGVNGVRLKLKITASNPNFRKLVYETNQGAGIPLLQELSQLVESTYQKDFILTGISRLCAFYLAKGFSVENEYRALYRSWKGFGPQPKSDGVYQFIDVPLGASMSDTGYQIEVLEVQSNETLNIPSKYSVEARN